MSASHLTRRSVVRAAGLGATAAMLAPAISSSRSAGKLTVAFWHHPVGGTNEVLSALCRQWADEARVEIHIDFVANTRVADREAQQRSGHDIVVHPTWQLALHRRLLEPVDDVMRPLLELHGAASPVADYLEFLQGRWHSVPATVPSQLKSCCSRFDLLPECVRHR